jgi:hypothetical protein
MHTHCRQHQPLEYRAQAPAYLEVAKAQRVETHSAHALSSGLYSAAHATSARCSKLHSRAEPSQDGLPRTPLFSRTNQIDEMPIAMRYAVTAANALFERFEPARG